MKSLYPCITLECAIPCETQAVKWNERDRNIYFDLLAKCDKETLLQQNYTFGCMQKRNEYMVDNPDYVIAVGTVNHVAPEIRLSMLKRK